MRWSSVKYLLLNSVPYGVRKYQNLTRNGSVLLYVIMSSTEARWLVWWPIHTAQAAPYAIRATQSHKGGDLDLSSMYKRTTIDNFHDSFGKDSRWHHNTRFPAAVSIAECGIAPGGYENLVNRTQKLWNCRPIHLASSSTGEWQMKEYPGASIQFSYDPLWLPVDEGRRQEVRESGNTRDLHWAGFYLSTTGNILSWAPVLFSRQCVDRIFHLKHVPKFTEDQPGERTNQRSVVEPQIFSDWTRCSTVYFDVAKDKLGENDAFAAFREQDAPLMHRPDPRSIDLKCIRRITHLAKEMDNGPRRRRSDPRNPRGAGRVCKAERCQGEVCRGHDETRAARR